MAVRGIRVPTSTPENAEAWAGAVVGLWCGAGEPRGTGWVRGFGVLTGVSAADRRRLVGLLKEGSGGRLSNRAVAALFGVSEGAVRADVRLLAREADGVAAFLREAGNAVRGAVDAATAREAVAVAPARLGIARKRVGALMRDLEALDSMLRESLS